MEQEILHMATRKVLQRAKNGIITEHDAIEQLYDYWFYKIEELSK